MASNHNQQGGNKGNNQSGGTSNRGFASMDPDRQRQIAAEGGRAAHASGNAHEFNSEEARRAGAEGGRAAHASGNAHEFTSEEARRAGSMSHKNDGNMQNGRGASQQSGSHTRGGTHEQHVQAGSQSHKNDHKR
jgi:general stress protein YciG